jgi:type IV pilus assembly protein PilC
MPARPSVREQAVVFREFATLVGAGLALLESLAELQKRPLSKPFERFLRSAVKRVSSGQKLSQAMRDQQGMFSGLVIALIEAGEEGGHLEEMLRTVAQYLERELELRRMIARETFYPKVLVGAAILIPLATRVIIGAVTNSLGEAIQSVMKSLTWWGIVAAMLYALWLAWLRFRSTTQVALVVDRLKLYVPLLGGAILRLSLTKVARGLAALYAAGVALPRAVDLAAEAAGNDFVEAEFKGSVGHLERGGKLSEALSVTSLRNTLLVRLLQTGEQTGNMDDMLTKAADHYEDEAETQIRRVAIGIVPVAVIIMGCVVGYMIIKFYVGMYSGLF